MAHRSIGIMAVILGAAMLAASARAAVVPWNSPAGGDFNTGANWVGGVVPGASDVALFDLSSNAYTVTAGDNVTIGSLRVEDDGQDLSPIILDLGLNILSTSGAVTVGSGAGNEAWAHVKNGTLNVDTLVVGTAQGRGFLELQVETNVANTVSVAASNGGAVDGSALSIGASGALIETNAGDTFIGSGAGSFGELLLNAGYAKFVGHFGVGLGGGAGGVRLSQGAVLQNMPGWTTVVGGGGNGEASVAGIGSHWEVQGTLTIGSGNNGEGYAFVEDGGLITAERLTLGSIGLGSESSGYLFVSSPGSSVQIDNEILVNGGRDLDFGAINSKLLIEGGSSVSTFSLRIGSAPGQSAEVEVRDGGSTLDIGGYILIGTGGFGQLTINNGGAVSVASIWEVGTFPGGSGSVTVSGDDSSLVAQDLRMGLDDNSAGRMEVRDGATVTLSGIHRIGYADVSSGVIIVDGATLDFGAGSTTYIGEDGWAILKIENGGVVAGGVVVFVGSQPGTAGSIELKGPDSRFDATGSIQVGTPGVALAYILLTDGPTVSAPLGISIVGPNVFGLTGSALLGIGTIEGSLTNSGDIDTTYGGGPIPGTMFITGDFTQLASGDLKVGLSQSADRLDVGGTATLGGRLTIQPNAFTNPVAGASYPLLTANSIVGAFSSIWAISYNDGLTFTVDNGKGASLVVNAHADCNNNDVPDADDIANSMSQDVDMNDIPDECADPGNACGHNRWWCAQNWPLGDIPGEFSADFHVTMGAGDNLCLDDDATIQSLILRNASFLDMSDPDGGTCDGDLVLDGVEGMTIDNSTLAIGPGRRVDFGLGGTTSLWLRRGGSIDADGSTIDVGDVLIESGGSYRSAVSVTSPPNDALLRAGNITLRSGFSATPSELNLSGDMEVIADGDVVIDGTGAPCDCGAAARANRADVTPPVFRNDGRRFVAVDNLSLKGSIDITIEGALVLGGNFENESVCPGCADLSGGTVQLNGPGLFNGEPRAGVFPQRFEVASPDMGPGVEIPDQPWALDTLEIGAGVEATFDDRFDNDGAGQVPCSEALYVRHLIIGAGASAVARHVRLYYDTLTIDPTGTLTEIGCGVASEIACILAAPADPEPSPQTKNRYLSFVPGNPGSPTALRVTLTNLNGFPSFNGQVRWVGPPELRLSGNGGQFWAAPLQCTPHFMEWDNVGVVHVYGAEVVPSSTFDVQVVHANCDGALGVGASYSSPLSVLTGKWGDVQTPYGAGQPTFADISAIVATFAGNASSIGKARAQLQPNVPNPAVPISFADISACVSAFRGIPYSFAGPSVCP